MDLTETYDVIIKPHGTIWSVFVKKKKTTQNVAHRHRQSDTSEITQDVAHCHRQSDIREITQDVAHHHRQSDIRETTQDVADHADGHTESFLNGNIPKVSSSGEPKMESSSGELDVMSLGAMKTESRSRMEQIGLEVTENLTPIKSEPVACDDISEMSSQITNNLSSGEIMSYMSKPAASESKPQKRKRKMKNIGSKARSCDPVPDSTDNDCSGNSSNAEMLHLILTCMCAQRYTVNGRGTLEGIQRLLSSCFSIKCSECGTICHPGCTKSWLRVTRQLEPAQLVCTAGPCEYTPYTCRSWYKLTHHHTVHHMDDPHECAMCGKIFQNRVRYQKHVSSVHMNIECEQCGLVFKNTRAIKEHVKKAHQGFSEKCALCGLVLGTSSSMRRHLKRHLNEEQVKRLCDICGKEYRGQGALDTHYLSHVKETTCTICDKKFTTMLGFVKHKMIHNKEGRVVTKCPECEKTFKTKQGLKLHLQNIHNVTNLLTVTKGTKQKKL